MADRDKSTRHVDDDVLADALVDEVIEHLEAEAAANADAPAPKKRARKAKPVACLLYTSDAADE